MELLNYNNDIRIGSREVAVMLEIDKHSNLIRKIENISNILISSKMSVSKYWVESSYIDSNNRNKREFLLSKKGCELLAHKTTGEKGVLFTVKYMEKFEAMEKALSNMNTPSYLIDDSIERAKRWIKEEQQRKALLFTNKEQEKVISKQEDTIKELEPKAEVYDTLIKAEDWKDMSDVAKILNKGIGRNKIYAFLRNKGVLDKKNKPYQHYVDKGYFKLVITPYERKLSNGNTLIVTTTKTVISPKGVTYLNKIIV